MKGKRRGDYTKLTQEEKALIGKYAKLPKLLNISQEKM